MCKCRAQSASVGWDDVSFVLSLSHTHVLALLLSPTPSLSPFSFFFKQEQCVGYFGHFSAQQTVQQMWDSQASSLTSVWKPAKSCCHEPSSRLTLCSMANQAGCGHFFCLL